jgi:hypothetical protein
MIISSANEIRTWKLDSFELVDEHKFHGKLQPINTFAVRPESKIFL